MNDEKFKLFDAEFLSIVILNISTPPILLSRNQGKLCLRN